VVILAVMFVAAVPLSSDVMKHRVVESLSARMDSDVELGDLHLRVFPSLHAEGAGLVIRKRGSVDVPPLISVKRFSVDADLVGLMRKHVALVRVVGLDIQIPPSDNDSGGDQPRPSLPRVHGGSERGRQGAPASGSASNGSTGATRDAATPNTPAATDSSAAIGATGADAASAQTPPAEAPDGAAARQAASATDSVEESIEKGVVIDTLVSNDGRLVILPRDKNKGSRVWAIHALTMHNVGATTAMPFEAKLTNAVPPGEIATTGSFGPWMAREPGDTPLRGDFTFENADLSVFHGISGTLAAKGKFGGSLERIGVDGETDVPNFTIAVGGHPFPLHATYRSLVDGTNGDTRLERIDATFLQSHLLAAGAVLDGPPGARGRTVTLDVQMDRARIEDIMKMAVRTAKPPMVGALQLTTKFLLPPGESDVSQRLRLDGRFTMANARFTNIDVQSKINELSHRSSGKDPNGPKNPVLSRFDGRFRLGNGALTIPDLTFDVPGAKVQLAGTYALKPETLGFRGMMSMDAKLSETQTGWKRLVLKAVDPFFRRNGGGSEIPFKIEGTRNNPKFGLDVRRVFRRNGTGEPKRDQTS